MSGKIQCCCCTKDKIILLRVRFPSPSENNERLLRQIYRHYKEKQKKVNQSYIHNLRKDQ